jgi:hypothetical protein
MVIHSVKSVNANISSGIELHLKSLILAQYGISNVRNL